MSLSAVYIGGFGNGRSSAKRVCESIASLPDFDETQVKGFTFSEAMKNPEELRRESKGAQYFLTHSAGFLALARAEIKPIYLEVHAAPIPSSVSKLLLRTLNKTVRMHLPGAGLQRPSDISRIIEWDASSIAEFSTHPSGNFRYLKHIAEFNAFEVFDDLKDHVDGGLIYYDKDAYFKRDEVIRASEVYPDVPFRIIPGEHDELVLRPEACLSGEMSDTVSSFQPAQ